MPRDAPVTSATLPWSLTFPSAASADHVNLFAARAHRTRIGQSRITFDAGNRTQVLVDCGDVPVGHGLKGRPGHHLQVWTELRVRMIGIDARAYDIAELFERCASGRPPSFVGCQVARNEERPERRRAARQIGCLIDDLW